MTQGENLVKSTRGKRAGIILAVLAFLLMAAVVIVPRLIDLNRYRGLIASELETALGGRVSVGTLAWGIGNGIWLEADGLAIHGATVFPGDLELPRIYAKVSLLPLLTKKVVVKKLMFENPEVTIRLVPSPEEKEEAQGEPASVPPAVAKGSTDSPLPVEILIEKLELREGRLRLEDSLTVPGQQIVNKFSDVSIEGFHLEPGRAMHFQLAFREASEPGLGSLKGKGTFNGLTEAFTLDNPELSLQATLSDLDVEILEPYLRMESLAERLGGRISLTIDYQGDFGGHFRVDGEMDLTQLSYTDPSLWEQALPGAKTTLSYKAVFDPEEIKLEKLELTLGNISLSLEALLEDWRKQPIIKDAAFSSEVPLVEVIPLVPWKRLGDEGNAIRQSLAGGGKVIVEQAAFPEFQPANIPEEWRPLLAGSKASITLSELFVKTSPLLPGLEHLSGKLHLEEGVLTAEGLQARLGPLTLPPLALRATRLTGKPKVTAVAKGPMQLLASNDARIDELLMEYGLKELTGRTEMDMLVHYDHARPESWDTRVDLVLDGVRARTQVADVRFSDLRGRITLTRKKNLEISVDNLRGKMDQSPLHLDGKLTRVGRQEFVVDARARTEGLDLALASAVYPPMRGLELGGKIDLDVDLHYPSNDPMASRAKGIVKGRNLGMRLEKPSLRVKDGDARFELAGKTVKLEDMNLLLNDQQMTLSGQVTDFRDPNVLLRVQSPNLNVDRLLPPDADTHPSGEPTEKADATPVKAASLEEEPGKPELPPLLRRLTAQVQADVTRGEYRGQAFQDLKLEATYERGVLKSHAFDVGVADGHFGTQGSADLRNLKHIPFLVKPTLSAVPLESIARLVGIGEVSFKCPVTTTGQMEGRTGSAEELLGSLRGTMELEAGPGRVFELGPFGKVLFRVLDFVSVESLVARTLLKHARQEGFSFESIRAQYTFQEGTLNVDAIVLKSSALDAEATVEVDLVKQQLKGTAEVAVLETLDKGLGYVPVVGGVAAGLTRLYMNLHGSLEDPKVVPRPDKRATEAVKGVIQAPGKAGKGVIKGLDKIF